MNVFGFFLSGVFFSLSLSLSLPIFPQSRDTKKERTEFVDVIHSFARFFRDNKKCTTREEFFRLRSRRGITHTEEERRRRRIFKSKLAALSCFFSLSLSLYRLEIHFHRERRTNEHI